MKVFGTLVGTLLLAILIGTVITLTLMAWGTQCELASITLDMPTRMPWYQACEVDPGTGWVELQIYLADR